MGDGFPSPTNHFSLVFASTPSYHCNHQPHGSPKNKQEK